MRKSSQMATERMFSTVLSASGTGVIVHCIAPEPGNTLNTSCESYSIATTGE